jgi:hypothetical protein
MRLRILTCTLLAGSACTYIARDTPTYERDTSALLDSRDQAMQACYDAELKRNPNLAGKLTVKFTVEKRTGKIIQLDWDRNRSTVTDTLATCVTSALYGLTLDEADRRDGHATYTYAFRVIQAAPGP